MVRIALLLLLYLFCPSEALDKQYNRDENFRNNGNRVEKNRRIADLDPKDQYWNWYNEYLEQVNNEEFYDVDTTHHYKIKKVPVSEDTRHQGGEHPGYVTLPADQQPQNTFVDGADMYNIGQPNYEAGAGSSYAVDSDGGAELGQDSELDAMESENAVIAVDGDASAPNSDPLLSEVPLVDQESGTGLGSGQSAPKVIYPDYPLTRLNRRRTACPAGRPTSASLSRERKLDAPPPPSQPRAHLRGRRGLALKATPDQSAAASAAARPHIPFAPEGDEEDLTHSGPVIEIPTMPPLEVSDNEFIHVSGKPKLGQLQGPTGGAGTEAETRGGRGGDGRVDFSMGMGQPWEDLPPGAEFPFGWSGGRR